jgi:hypothetical protein
VGRAESAGLGVLETQSASEWAYEVTSCEGGERVFYNNFSCNYFQTAIGTIQGLAHFASLIWWMDDGHTPGSALLGYGTLIDPAFDGINLCMVRTTEGGPGLCDEVTLEYRLYFSFNEVTVTFGDRTELRTLVGNCD